MRTKRERHQGLGEHHKKMRMDTNLLIIECLANHHAFDSSVGVSYRKLAEETDLSVITVKRAVYELWVGGFVSKKKIVRTTRKMNNMGRVTNHKMTSVFFNFYNTELSTLKTIQYEEQRKGKRAWECLDLAWDVLGKDCTEAEKHYLVNRSVKGLNDDQILILSEYCKKRLH